ncbi:hypothetical protein FRC08_009868 [Ceratobasidium sp. 394]|nr:hypothetical protein FRC08_009868 [Ceratobasidium sp. 394]
MLVQIDRQLPSVLLDERNLQLTNSKLRMVRNVSWSLAPISALPEEILSTIFKLAAHPCLMNSRGKTTLVVPTVLSSVCSSWRQIALSIHSLWSHLDIRLTEPVGGPWYLRAGLWATRSHSAPLYIHASNDDGSQYTKSSATARDFVAFLRPLVPRMSGLEMGFLDHVFRDHVLGILSCWIRYGSRGSARQLKLGGDFLTRDLRTQLLSMDEQVTSGEFESFFQSVDTLHLDWLIPPPLDSTVYHGLVELRFEGPTFRSQYSQQQFSTVLAACPKLRTLTFFLFRLVLEPDFSPIPIALDDLKTLAVGYSDHVLPLITSSSPSIDMSVYGLGPGGPLDLTEVYAFIIRCKVTRLYIGKPFFRNYLEDWLGRVPHVETLALDLGSISEDLKARGTESEFSDPWPRLRKLILRFCTASQDGVRRLVSMHPLQELYIVAAGEFSLWDTEEGEQFENELRASIPKVVCTKDSAKDPTNEWDFVHDWQRGKAT